MVMDMEVGKVADDVDRPAKTGADWDRAGQTTWRYGNFEILAMLECVKL